MSTSDVVTVLSKLRHTLKVKPLTEATHDLGVELSGKYLLSDYDAMTVASGLSCGATRLYSEDTQSGLPVEKRLRVENPFASAFKLP